MRSSPGVEAEHGQLAGGGHPKNDQFEAPGPVTPTLKSPVAEDHPVHAALDEVLPRHG